MTAHSPSSINMAMTKTTESLQPPFETLTVGECLGRARVLLARESDRKAFAEAAARITRIEDWLELEHPKLDRNELRVARRKLEACAE